MNNIGDHSLGTQLTGLIKNTYSNEVNTCCEEGRKSCPSIECNFTPSQKIKNMIADPRVSFTLK